MNLFQKKCPGCGFGVVCSETQVLIFVPTQFYRHRKLSISHFITLGSDTTLLAPTPGRWGNAHCTPPALKNAKRPVLNSSRPRKYWTFPFDLI